MNSCWPGHCKCSWGLQAGGHLLECCVFLPRYPKYMKWLRSKVPCSAESEIRNIQYHYIIIFGSRMQEQKANVTVILKFGVGKWLLKI
jgi:hypothetical protein